MLAKTSDLETFYSAALEEGLIRKIRRTRYYLGNLFKDVNFEGARVLDIGGGAGKFSYYAACRGAEKVVCLEPEFDGSFAGMRAKFTRMGERLGMSDRAVLQPVRLQEFDPQSGKFDIILLHNSVNHLDEDACITLHKSEESQSAYLELFRKISTLATDGAQLIICDCSRHNFFATLHLKNPLAPTIEWHKHQPPHLWADLLKEAGFAQPEVRWTSFVPLCSLEKYLTSNRLSSYFLFSHFCLRMKKCA